MLIPESTQAPKWCQCFCKQMIPEAWKMPVQSSPICTLLHSRKKLQYHGANFSPRKITGAATGASESCGGAGHMLPLSNVPCKESVYHRKGNVWEAEHATQINFGIFYLTWVHTIHWGINFNTIIREKTDTKASLQLILQKSYLLFFPSVPVI